MSSNRLTTLALLAVIVIVAVLYLPSFDWPLEWGILHMTTFVLTFDLVDSVPELILEVENPHSQGFIRPVSHFAMYIDYLISDYRPLGKRVTQLLFHVMNALGVFALSRFLFQKNPWAVLAAAIFAFHPNSPNAVILTMPQDLLASLFCLWGLYFWGKSLLVKKWLNPWMILTLSSIALGILSKELLLIFPLLALSLHITLILIKRVKRVTFRYAWFGYVGQFVVLALYMIYRTNVLGGLGGYGASEHLAINIEIIRNLLRVMNGSFYVENNLVAAQLGNIKWLMGTLLAALVTILGLRPRKIGNPAWIAVFGFFYMFVASATVLNFKWFGWWYIYISLGGIAIGLVALLREAYEKFDWAKKLAVPCGLTIVVLLIMFKISHINDIARHVAPRNKMFNMASELLVDKPDANQYVLNARTKAVIRFNVFEKTGLSPVVDSLFAADRIKVAVMGDHPSGKVFTGFTLLPPYNVPESDANRYISLDYINGDPRFTPIDEETFRRILAETARDKRYM